MEKENWLPVVGYEGLYEVSDLGRVRSLDRVITLNRKSGPQDRLYSGTVLVGRYGREGYQYHVLCSRDKAHKTLKTHILVAQAFIGERPINMVVDRIDHRKKNNKAFNLQYISTLENLIRGRNCNLKKGKTSRFTGVMVRDDKIIFRKSWRHEGEKRAIRKSGFTSEIDAHKEYLKYKLMPVSELNKIWEADRT